MGIMVIDEHLCNIKKQYGLPAVDEIANTPDAQKKIYAVLTQPHKDIFISAYDDAEKRAEIFIYNKIRFSFQKKEVFFDDYTRPELLVQGIKVDDLQAGVLPKTPISLGELIDKYYP